MNKGLIWASGLAALVIVGGILGYKAFFKAPEPVPAAPEKAVPAEVTPLSPQPVGPPAGSESRPGETAPSEALKPPAAPPPETVEEAAKEPTSQPEKEHFGVLVAKFRTYQEASKLMAQLRRQGKPTYIRPSPEEPTLYEVWVAPYNKEEQAQAAAKSIKAKYGRSPRVQRIEVLPPK